jgi:hypothetical protein
MRRSGTVRDVQPVQDERSETLASSHSRFKNERILVKIIRKYFYLKKIILQDFIVGMLFFRTRKEC